MQNLTKKQKRLICDYIDETGSVRSHHDGRKNFFFEVYIPEAVFPMAFKALDFAVFWCHNRTQSERVTCG